MSDRSEAAPLKEAWHLADRPDRRAVVLTNGMTVIGQRIAAAPVVAVRAYVRAGSALEGPLAGSGLTHLLEHVVSGGPSARHSETDLLRRAERIGGVNNAYTSSDHLCYHVNAAGEDLAEAVDLVAEWVARADLRREVFERERGVIRHEWEADRDDPGTCLEELFFEAAYRGHPQGYPVIGRMDAFDRLTFDDVVEYHRRTHTPANTILVVAGAAEPQDAIAAAIRAFRNFFGPLSDIPPLADAPIPAAPIRVCREMVVDSASMMHGWLTVREGSGDDAALDVLSQVLADGDQSRVVREVQWERQIVHGVVATHESYHHCNGTFRLTAQLDAGNCDAAEQAFAEQIERLRRAPVTEQELARARRQSEVAVRAMRQTAEGWASQLGQDFLATGSCDYSDAYLEQIGALRTGDLSRVAATYLRPSSRIVATIMPVRRQQATPVKTTRRPDTTHTICTATGRPLVVREMPDAAFVSINVTLTGGLSLETASTNGVHHLLAEMLHRGTGSQPAERIAEAFADCGSALSIAAGLDATSLQFTSLARDAEPLARTLAEVLNAPALSEDQLDRLRPMVGDALARFDDEWHGQLLRAARRRFFSASPYRFITLGTADNVARLAVDDLRSAHRSMLAAKAVIGIAGRINPREAEQIADSLFDGAPPVESGFPDAILFDPPNEAGRLSVGTCDEDRRVAAIFVGLSIPAATDIASRAPLAVIGAVLTGYAYSGGRLYEALRGGDREDVYEVGGAELRGRLPGYFAVLAACEPARAAAVADTIRGEVARLREALVGDDELARAKASVLAAEQDQLQTPAEYARRLAHNVWLGLGVDDDDVFRESIRSVRADELRTAAQAFLKHPVCVVMTPASGLSCWGDAANQESVPWELPAREFAKSS